MDALVTMCSWNTNVVLVWAWMRVSVGCWNTKVIKYGLGMDALESGCSWNTTVIVVWAKMHW